MNCPNVNSILTNTHIFDEHRDVVCHHTLRRPNLINIFLRETIAMLEQKGCRDVLKLMRNYLMWYVVICSPFYISDIVTLCCLWFSPFRVFTETIVYRIFSLFCFMYILIYVSCVSMVRSYQTGIRAAGAMMEAGASGFLGMMALNSHN